MSCLIILLASVLCLELSLAENLHEKLFYETSGPYFFSKEAVNWTDAKMECKKLNLELASVISEEERLALNTVIKKNELVPKDKWSGYWLSGIRHNDGRYYWDSTGTQVDSFVRGWALGEPSHAYGREDCIELKWDQLDLGWNDYFCDETRRYICQVPRKFKPKTIKKKLQKQNPLYQKEWQYKDSNEYDSTKAVEKKETEIYRKPEDSIDFYWTTLGHDYDDDYTTETGYDNGELSHTTEPEHIL